jgi:ribosomal protein L9
MQWALGAVMVAALAGCGSQGGGSSSLATINGETITDGQLNKHMSRKTSVRVQTANGAAEAQLSESLDFQALQDLIGQRIIMQLAKDDGVYPTDGEILQELDFRGKLNPNYVKQLNAAGYNLESIKENLALELAREKLISKGVKVTDAEVDEYIKNNPQQFTNPATATMRWVFAKTDARKAEVDKALATGQSFTAVATQLSEAPGARSNGGQFEQNVVSRMPQQLQAMVAKTAEGRMTDWLRLTDGWARWYVERKAAAKKMELSKEQKELVRRQIAQQRGQQATDLNKRVLDKLKEAQITVKDDVLSELWKKRFDAIKEELSQQNASSGSLTTGGGTGSN